ncbi:MAG: VTT domain-containing protein [Polyangiaceae bacterium]|nr:VTT domain-containing protein [Polyangiaceae bacterium]
MTDATAATRSRELGGLLLQLGAGLGALAIVVLAIGRFFGAELDAAGRAFVERFGYAGVAVGVFTSDAFTSPIPPQAYVVAALAGGGRATITIATGCAASVVAGAVAYQIGRGLRRVPWLARRLDRTRHRVDELFARWGSWAVVVASVSPVPYSALCYLCGMTRMPARLFVALLALRVPRFVVMCLVVGWSLGATRGPGPRAQNPRNATMSASSASESTSAEKGGILPE